MTLARLGHDGNAPLVGLVLSGGGAKGAYQVGVIRALDECGIRVGAVAGASIGALNGALVVSSATLADAAQALDELWRNLAVESPLKLGGKLVKVRVPAFLLLLVAFGLHGTVAGPIAVGVGAVLSQVNQHPSVKRLLADRSGVLEILTRAEGLLSQRPVKAIIDRHVPESGLPTRVPLHVAVFPSQGWVKDLLGAAGAALGLADTEDSQFVHVQALRVDQQRLALLASAALPLLFATQDVERKRYSDGGQGGWRTVQGNTPIQPLLDMGCRTIFVTHLNDGSLWDHKAFPDACVVDIRPEKQIVRGKLDLLGFNNKRIPTWIAQGYDDTMRRIEEVRDVLSIHAEFHASHSGLRRALRETGEVELRSAMKRLDKG